MHEADIDLTEKFSARTLGAEAERQLAEQVLDVMLALTWGRNAALVTLASGQVAPFAARAIDAEIPGRIEALTQTFKPMLEKGETVCVSGRTGDPRFPGQDQGPGGFALVPVFGAEWLGLVMTDHPLVALLYVDSDDPRFCSEFDAERMSRFARIVGRMVFESSSLGGSLDEGEGAGRPDAAALPEPGQDPPD